MTTVRHPQHQNVHCLCRLWTKQYGDAIVGVYKFDFDRSNPAASDLTDAHVAALLDIESLFLVAPLRDMSAVRAPPPAIDLAADEFESDSDVDVVSHAFGAAAALQPATVAAAPAAAGGKRSWRAAFCKRECDSAAHVKEPPCEDSQPCKQECDSTYAPHTPAPETPAQAHEQHMMLLNPRKMRCEPPAALPPAAPVASPDVGMRGCLAHPQLSQDESAIEPCSCLAQLQRRYMPVKEEPV